MAEYNKLPPLIPKHFPWWIHTYGQNNVKTLTPEDLHNLYQALQSGNLAEIQHYVKKYPHIPYTKIFGNHQRSLLYVASFLGRADICKWLIHDVGADPFQVHGPDGTRPIDVAASMTLNLIQRQQILHAAGVLPSPTPVLCCKTLKSGRITQDKYLSLSIYFNEPVREFILANSAVEILGGKLGRLGTLTKDRYTLRIELDGISGASCHVKILAKAAKRASANEHDVHLDAGHYSIPSNTFSCFYLKKNL